jgi:hypothetical protein
MNKLLAVLVAGLFSVSAFAASHTGAPMATPVQATEVAKDVKADAKEAKADAKADAKVTKAKAKSMLQQTSRLTRKKPHRSNSVCKRHIIDANIGSKQKRQGDLSFSLLGRS